MLSTVLVLALLAEAPSPAGGVMAPAVLPGGSNAVYGVVGAPEVGAGYRQGFAPLEVEARAMFNIFEISGLLEVGVKFKVLEQGPLQVGVGVAVGLLLDSGSKYFDAANFGSVALRPRVAGLLSYALSDLVTLLARVDVPVAISMTVRGVDVTPEAGVGAEFHVGGNLSLMVLGQLGFDSIKESLGVTQTRLAWGIQLGVGYRIF